MTSTKLRLFDRQGQAWHILHDSGTTLLLYGGAAGGAKTFLGCAWQWYRRLAYAGTRGLIGRARLTLLRQTTLRTLLDVAHRLGLEPGRDYTYLAGENRITLLNGSEILLKDLFSYPSDPEFTALGGLEITDAFIDEAAEVSEKAVNMVASRIRYKIHEVDGVPRMLLTCNPQKGWLYRRFYKPWLENCLPPHEAFLPALLQHNGDAEFVATYGQQLQHLDPVSRRRLLLGDWDYADDALCLFDRAGVHSLFTNAHVEPGPAYLTADVARYGQDATVIAIWSGLRLTHLYVERGLDTNQVKARITVLMTLHKVPRHHLLIDSDGVGAGVADGLPGCVQFNAAGRALASRHTVYLNLRAQCWHKLAELVEQGQIWVQADAAGALGRPLIDVLQEELAAIKHVDGEGRLQICSKDEIRRFLGRSPDVADALMMRMYWCLQPAQFNYR